MIKSLQLTVEKFTLVASIYLIISKALIPSQFSFNPCKQTKQNTKKQVQNNQVLVGEQLRKQKAVTIQSTAEKQDIKVLVDEEMGEEVNEEVDEGQSGSSSYLSHSVTSDSMSHQSENINSSIFVDMETQDSENKINELQDQTSNVLLLVAPIFEVQQEKQQIINAHSFSEFVQEIIREKYNPDSVFSDSAIQTLREGAENYMYSLFSDAQLCAEQRMIKLGKQELFDKSEENSEEYFEDITEDENSNKKRKEKVQIDKECDRKNRNVLHVNANDMRFALCLRKGK